MPHESLAYLVEKFRSGVQALDEWPALSGRERLLNAYTGQVCHADRPGPGVPAELRARMSRLHATMRAVPDPTQELGTFASSVAAMTNAEADALADEIRAIAAELIALRGG